MQFTLRLRQLRTLLIVVDLILVNLTTLLALWIMAVRGGRSFDDAYLREQAGWFIFLSIFWLLSAFLNGLYDSQKIVDLPTTVPALLRTIILITLAYFGIYFFLWNALPRGIVLYQGVGSFILIGFWRVLYALMIQRAAFAHKVIIVGSGWAGQTIAAAIHQHANVHYQILGFVDDDPAKRGKVIAGGGKNSTPTFEHPVLGASRDLLRLVQEQSVPEIILAVSQDISTPLFQAILACKEQGIQITLMPVLFEQLTGMVPIEHIGDNWNVALPLDSAEAGGWYPIAKRIFDIIGATIGLCVFFILLPFIALTIHLDSPGPIFYTQKRAGKGGKVFRLIKLRTMIPDAEANGGAQHAQRNDPRITRSGKILRKMRLDEMPQLINVLKGDMSAVGPRPERPALLTEMDQVIPFHRLRNAVKPGMAGWAVLNYDYVDSLEDAKIRLQYDLYYIKHQSLWLDFMILSRMFEQVFALKGR